MRLAQTESPDLVLLDIWMPDVDGITLLREWSVAASDGCPVVMMSGHSTVETAVEATRLGAFDFVEKPLSLAKLLRTVERALDAGRRHRHGGRGERRRGNQRGNHARQHAVHGLPPPGQPVTFSWSHFLTENRSSPFRKMLQSAPVGPPNPTRLKLEVNFVCGVDGELS